MFIAKSCADLPDNFSTAWLQGTLVLRMRGYVTPSQGKLSSEIPWYAAERNGEVKTGNQVFVSVGRWTPRLGIRESVMCVRSTCWLPLGDRQNETQWLTFQAGLFRLRRNDCSSCKVNVVLPGRSPKCQPDEVDQIASVGCLCSARVWSFPSPVEGKTIIESFVSTFLFRMPCSITSPSI
jgi:hypothetical protein